MYLSEIILKVLKSGFKIEDAETRQTSEQTYKRVMVYRLFFLPPPIKDINDIIKKHLVFFYAKEQV